MTSGRKKEIQLPLWDGDRHKESETPPDVALQPLVEREENAKNDPHGYHMPFPSAISQIYN